MQVQITAPDASSKASSPAVSPPKASSPAVSPPVEKPAEGASVTKPTSFAVSFAIAPLALKGAYLYLRNSFWFDNSVDFQIGADGLPNSSSTVSTQEVTTVFGDVSSAAVAVVGKFAARVSIVGAPAKPTPQDCYNAVAAAAAAAPMIGAPASFVSPDFAKDSTPSWQLTNGSVEIPLKFGGSSANSAAPTGQGSEIQGTGRDRFQIWVRITRNPTPTFKDTTATDFSPGANSSPNNTYSSSNRGFVAFLPDQVSLQLVCYASTDGTRGDSIGTLSPPVVKSAWLERIKLNPERALFSAPQDSFTFNDGILTEHKFTNQSSAKNVVEAGLLPLKAVLSAIPVPSQTTKVTTVVSPSGTTKTTETDTTK